jgi:hypothetical protein
VARYLHGLRPAIHDALQVHTIEDVAVAQVKVRAIEQSLTRRRAYTPNRSPGPLGTSNPTNLRPPVNQNMSLQI